MTTDTLDAAVRALAERVSEQTTMPDVVIGELIVGVRVLSDPDSNPSESDAYGPADVDAFQDGEWRFIGVRVVIAFRGVEVASSGMWGVELGRTEGDIEISYLEGIIHSELNDITDKLPAIHHSIALG